jgi:membrane protein implicated in regulation of membrane protease activity
MTQFYLFAAAVGVPLVVWFVLSGGDDGGEGSGDGVAAIMFRLLPLSSIAVMLATFGVAGLALGVVGTTGPGAVIAAGAVALIVGGLNTLAFSYLRRTDAVTDASDDELPGSIGRVVLPVSPDRRGLVIASVNGHDIRLSAVAHSSETEELTVGTPILVVEVNGGIVTVARLDTELT